MSRPGSQRHGLRLFAAYAGASLIPVSIVGAVLIHGYQQQALDRGRDQGGAQAAVIEEMAIAPALDSSGKLGNELSEAQRTRLQSATDLAIFNGSVARLRLRSFSGAVTFSDDGTVLGAVPSSDPAFSRAAQGDQVVSLVEDGQFSDAPAIRVLQPVIASSTGQAIGVLEVYLPYQAIKQKVTTETRRAVRRLGLGLAGLYSVLALISWWTTSSLRRHAVQQEHDALHDPLTGLPNRELFRRSAEQAIARGRKGETGALVLIDLDHFKEVNDTLGHGAGDELLCVVGQRLSEALRTDDTVARLGGDEFGLLMPQNGDRGSTVALLREMRDQLARDLVLNSVTVNIKASFGVAFYPEDANDVESLLQLADAAMYQGKHGSVGVIVHDPATAHHPTHAWMVEQDLGHALERDELRMYYQPIVALGSGEVESLQACVYWEHPRRGLLAPADFQVLARNSDVIEPLTEWILTRALSDLARWRLQGCGWNVAISIPARALGSADFVATVIEQLTATGTDAHDLHIDVAWSTLPGDSQTPAQGAARALSELGVTLAIDDFGAADTSLVQLRTVPAAQIKIAETFTAGVDNNRQDRAVIESVVHLGRTLGCLVSAKGVVSRATADWLKNAGCDHGQGDLWARPSPWTGLTGPFTGLAPPSPRMPIASPVNPDLTPGVIS